MDEEPLPSLAHSELAFDRLVVGDRDHCMADDRVVGLLTMRRVKAVAAPLRATLGEIACPLREVCMTTPEEPLVDLLPRGGDDRVETSEMGSNR